MGRSALAASRTTPIYPISTAPPMPPPSFPWETALTAVLVALGVAGGGYGLSIRNVAQKAGVRKLIQSVRGK